MSDQAERLRQVIGERRDQVERDLAEVDLQLAAGDLDEETAVRLRAAYRAELAAADRELRDLELGTGPLPGRSRRRVVIGTALMLVALGGIALLAAQALVLRPGGPITGLNVADDPVDLSRVSTEQMEAVINANLDDPKINGMRMALANRYFEQTEFSDAFRHYQAVLENEPTTVQAAQALGRMGWMTYQSGEPELAHDTLVRALEVDPDYGEGSYFLALVLLCGLDDHERAAGLLAEVRARADLPVELVPEVEEALAIARGGGSCA